MAASRIKGITIEIGGDTTKLQTALKERFPRISMMRCKERLLKLRMS